MIFDGFVHQLPDIDPVETQEWLDSLDAVVDDARQDPRPLPAVAKLLERARELAGRASPPRCRTPYVNTIPPEQEPWFPGDEYIERRIRALHPLERGGDGGQGQQARRRHRRPPVHLRLARPASTRSASTTSSAARTTATAGDHIYFQGHAAPGIYARAFLEGRLDRGRPRPLPPRDRPARGLSRYPHPRLMPDFWEFPTVSMGLGPITALYQARFNRYLHNRQLDDTSRQPGCGASSATASATSPRRSARISLASREQLDNLIFVVNCNLQRLDGPVRGNGKIIQELEAVFRGAGWNVIKVIWGSKWDELLAHDNDGVLLNKMNTTVDGEFQRYTRRERRLHPRALLRARPPAAPDGRPPHRRRAARPAPRRPRLPQAVRRLQGGHREPRQRARRR